MTDIRQEIQDTPRALGEMLEQARGEFDAVMRRTRWGDGPLTIIGCGASDFVSLTGTFAFETLLGWPVVARNALDFAFYSLDAVKQRSVVLAVSYDGDSEEAAKVGREVKSRGAILLALTCSPQSALARAAEGVLLLRAAGEKGPGPKSLLCQHAALSYLALLAAKRLKRPEARFGDLEAEFAKLPERLEWALTQLLDAVASLAGELKDARSLSVVGGGCYYPIALEAAREFQQRAGIEAQGVNATEWRPRWPEAAEEGGLVLFLSGSRSKTKHKIHEWADRAARANAKILSITDVRDRELQDRSKLAVLLPAQTEMVGSLLALGWLDWVAWHTARERQVGGKRANGERKEGG